MIKRQRCLPFPLSSMEFLALASTLDQRAFSFVLCLQGDVLFRALYI
jgi:hypothetical protein